MSDNDIKNLSYCLCSLLRHYGYTAGGALSCDSGGWYKFDDVIQEFTNPYKDREGNHLEWYKTFTEKFQNAHLLKQMKWSDWAICLWRAMEPKAREPHDTRS